MPFLFVMLQQIYGINYVNRHSSENSIQLIGYGHREMSSKNRLYNS